MEWTNYIDNITHAINNGLYYKNPLFGDNSMEKWLFSMQPSLETIAHWVEQYKPFCRISGARAISREFNIGHGVVIDNITKYKYYFPNGHLINK